MIPVRRLAMNTVASMLITGGVLMSPSALASDYPPAVEALPPIHIIQPDGVARSVSLADVFDHHGYACGPATVAFMAMQYALQNLYTENEIPRADDLLVLSHSPGGGVADVMDLLFSNGRPESRTLRPAGMRNAADSFEFQVMRKSTLQTVSIALDPALWPAGWFEIRDKRRAGTFTEADQAQLQSYQQQVTSTFPAKDLQTLFGSAEVRTVMGWGAIQSGELEAAVRAQR